MANDSSFAALPVRQRGTLEIIDTAMKLYRRYFGVLMGWSALVAVLFLLAFTVPFGALLVYPLIPGSGCCAVAAAVRGQNIAFGQVWEFTKPRFGALLLITFLSILLMAAAMGAITFVTTFLSIAGVWLMSQINASDGVVGVVSIIGVLAALVVGSVLSVLAYAWLGLVQIIACLEDDRRNATALGRAWELMKGSWKRVLGLATLLSIAIVMVMGIVGGTLGFIAEGLGAFADNASESLIIGLALTFSAFVGVFFLFWNPIQTLVLAVLYLDLRVRKEALDLEWNSYASAPPPPVAPSVATPAVATPAVATPAVATPAVATPAVATPAVATPAAAAVDVSAVELAPTSSGVAMPVVLSKQTPEPAAPSTAATSPLELTQETSSFSAAPSAPLPDAFDFSSSFSVGQSAPLSPGDAASLDDASSDSGRSA